MLILDKDRNELGNFDCGLLRLCKQEACICVRGLQYAKRSGQISSVEVLQGQDLFAIIPADGIMLAGTCMFTGDQLIIESKYRVTGHIKNTVCTCGGWSVYGKDADLHGNYCDLRTL